MWDRLRVFVASRLLLLAVVWFCCSILFGVSGRAMMDTTPKGFWWIIASSIGLLGFIAFVVSIFCVFEWIRKSVIGRYEWIYVMPDDKIVIKPNYDHEAYIGAFICLRMKVGGWFRVSRRMMTPFEGERIDHMRYEGDGDMTITLPQAKFTVPLSLAIQYLGSFSTSEFGSALRSLLDQAKALRRLDEKSRIEITILENHLRGLLCCMRGDDRNRPAKWVTKLRGDIIETLRAELPNSSNFRRDDVLEVKNESPDLGEARAASVEDGAKVVAPASNS